MRNIFVVIIFVSIPLILFICMYCKFLIPQAVKDISSDLSDRCKEMLERNAKEPRQFTKEWGEHIKVNLPSSAPYTRPTSHLSDMKPKVSALLKAMDSFSMKYDSSHQVQRTEVKPTSSRSTPGFSGMTNSEIPVCYEF